MFGFLKKKELKASEDTKVFFACYQSDKRSTTTLILEPAKTQSDKFHERYKGVDLFSRMSHLEESRSTKQMKGKLNSAKKQTKTLHSLSELDVFGQ